VKIMRRRSSGTLPMLEKPWKSAIQARFSPLEEPRLN